MKRLIYQVFVWIVSITFLASCQADQGNDDQAHDLIVYGGTSGGIIAAIQAARMNKKVLLLEPSNHLGGMTTGGLVWTDYGIEETVGGLAADFYDRIKAHYQQDQAWKNDNPQREFIMNEQSRFIRSFEPSVADSIFRVMLKEENVELHMNAPLARPGGVVKEGTEIKSINLEPGTTYQGKTFIDATYEGDLMAEAGVSYHVGREPKNQYNESFAGVLGDDIGIRQPKKFFGKKVNPYDDEGNLLPGIQNVPMGEPGAGDDKIQAYNVRLCLTSDTENKIPVSKPASYDPWTYELLARWIAAVDNKEALTLDNFLKVSPVPNRKTDINDKNPFSTDYIGANWDYPEGSYASRKQIFEDHFEFTKGLIYFLGNDPRVPSQVRKEMLQYGYPKDEYVDNGNITPQIYIREARRMIGEYVMIQQDCRENTIKAHSIGIGSYGVDSHHIQRIVIEGDEVINEGNFLADHFPYEIPYESILPKKSECTNLLVPVCISSSHIAFGSLRMEPVYMILGQSAATIAALALETETPLHQLDYQEIRNRLEQNGQKLKLADINLENVDLSPL